MKRPKLSIELTAIETAPACAPAAVAAPATKRKVAVKMGMSAPRTAVLAGSVSAGAFISSCSAPALSETVASPQMPSMV